ncbi:hypothetical protein MMC26_005500 [Xylographa opegraphella]|nr:hypothetical protein [Xylographa opegraphella]
MAVRGDSDRRIPLQPMNVEQIVEKALAYEYNPTIPLKYWFRTAGMLLKEAEIYEHEGNDQQTYLLLFRHAQLVLKNLAKHPDVSTREGKEALGLAEKDVVKSLKKLEILKPRIKKRYDRYEQLMKDRDARKTLASSRKQSRVAEHDGLGASIPHQRTPSDPAIAGNPETLVAEDNKELAVRLAHKELKRRAVARHSTLQAGISKEVAQSRRTAGLWGNWEEALAHGDRDADPDKLSQQLQSVHHQVELNKVSGLRNGTTRPSVQNTRPSYVYPTIPTNSPTGDLKFEPTSTEALPRREAGSEILDPLRPPKPPPKDIIASRYGTPAIPPKQPFSQPAVPSRSETASPLQDDLIPATKLFVPSAYLENGAPLRTIFLPPDLRHTFLSVAQANTRANLETCGILCGTLIRNALFISKLVIPDQESTSDTCETVNESDLFDYVDGEDLMVLGWIHTHPTQTCFMSSRDLHTHCGYQVMMPESIAIVCAPSRGE